MTVDAGPTAGPEDQAEKLGRHRFAEVADEFPVESEGEARHGVVSSDAITRDYQFGDDGRQYELRHFRYPATLPIPPP